MRDTSAILKALPLGVCLLAASSSLTARQQPAPPKPLQNPSDVERTFSPVAAYVPDLTGLNVFMNAGRTDPMVDPENSQRLADMLRDAGANVTLRWKAGGHGITPEDLKAARAWHVEHSTRSS